MQIEQMSNPRAKIRLRAVLASLNRELTQSRLARPARDDLPSDPSTPSPGDPTPDDFVFTHLPASDDDEIPGTPPPDLVETSQIETSHDEDDDEDHDETFYTVARPSRRPRFDATTGWFSGSIDEFHGFLRKGGPEGSRRVSREGSPGPVWRGGESAPLDEVVVERYLGRYEGNDGGK
ncbi:putative protein conserved in bacteria (DUF2263) [Teratosphaeria destructans]|uniref:Uncharacterized protein n=1 Tax=Teratosphaeria destructans TaxID=418781 RepID=A0A9W7W6L2_9PEZI|nr:putative protein conserved in bacteria (DUF2263) [Teratosphaeria destructans]